MAKNFDIEILRKEYILKYLLDNGLKMTELYRDAEESLKRFERSALYERFFRDQIKEVLFYDNLKIKPSVNLIIYGGRKSGKTVLMNHIVEIFNDNCKHIDERYNISPFEIVKFYDIEKWHLELRKSIAIDEVPSYEDLEELFAKHGKKPENLIAVMTDPVQKSIKAFKNHLCVSKSRWGKYEY